MRSVGVVGLGIVGGTVSRAFTEAGIVTRPYDRYLEIGKPEDLAGCAVVFVCVPTPGAEDGAYDLAEVWDAVRTVGAHVETGTVVAVKSTVPPGTCDALAAASPRLEVAVVPEFLVAERPVDTFTRPDRIVIGSRSREAAELLAELLSRVAPTAPVIVLTPTEAELVKLCSNAMLAAKVAMANELSEVCRRFGVAWAQVQEAVGLDRRIGPNHLTVTPERGFGGQCLPKDLDGLIAASNGAGHFPGLLDALAEFNRQVRRETQRGDARVRAARS